MSDLEWLQQHKNRQPKTAAPTDKTKETLAPGVSLPPASTASQPDKKTFPVILVIGVVAVLIGAYFYFDTQSRGSDRLAAQYATKQAKPAQRVLSAADIQANDEKNRAYVKKLEDDYYRQQISADILKLNGITTRFYDVYRCQ